jgi:hypothetical protein
LGGDKGYDTHDFIEAYYNAGTFYSFGGTQILHPSQFLPSDADKYGGRGEI